MLQAIELETVIAPDGKLPEAFREAFGRKAQVIVLLPEEAGFSTGEKRTIGTTDGIGRQN